MEEEKMKGEVALNTIADWLYQQGQNEAASLLRSRSCDLEDRVDENIGAAEQIAFHDWQREIREERKAALRRKCDDCPFSDDWLF